MSASAHAAGVLARVFDFINMGGDSKNFLHNSISFSTSLALLSPEFYTLCYSPDSDLTLDVFTNTTINKIIEILCCFPCEDVFSESVSKTLCHVSECGLFLIIIRHCFLQRAVGLQYLPMEIQLQILERSLGKESYPGLWTS